MRNIQNGLNCIKTEQNRFNQALEEKNHSEILKGFMKFFSDLWDSCFEIFNGIPKWPIETLNFHQKGKIYTSIRRPKMINKTNLFEL